MVIVAIRTANHQHWRQDQLRVGGTGPTRPTSGSKDAHWSPLFRIVGPWKIYIEYFYPNLKRVPYYDSRC